MSVKEALKELPCINKNNFAKVPADGVYKSSSKRLPVYVPTKDHKSNLIVTEKSNVILKFLHRTWDKKESNKRENKNDTGHQTPKKRIKV